MPSLTIPAITPTATYRITSIDLLRGLVMIIMALDHTRDMYHLPAMTADPLAPETTTVWIFFTRWITHFCAPAFVFLSGLSAYLSSQKKTSAEASWFLFKRGFWLIIVEILIVTFGITFDYKWGFIIWQVIWAIGCSMIILSLVRLLPNRFVLLIGCIIFFGHDLINYVRPPQPGPTDLITVFLTAFNNIIFIDQTHLIGDFYAILPWAGVMLIGYGIGHWFSKDYPAEKRKRNLLICGLSMTALFIILRFINKYGDPAPRDEQIEGWRSILTFLNASKYPPSLLYCCMTLGPAFVFLALSENIKGKWSRIISVYGKVPFFYYILHFYILHLLLVIFFYATGHKSSEIYSSFIGFRAADFGYTLPIVYVIWLSVVASLYYPCKWFYKYKMTHGQWWLKYL